MKRMFFWLISFSLLATISPIQIATAQQIPQMDEPEGGAVVCEPAAYSTTSSDCVQLGPSQYLNEMAKLGMTFPPRPLPAYKPDPSLTQLPYRYYHLNDEYVPIYSSPGQKGSGVNQFPPGFVYVSYTDVWDQAGYYFLLQNGGWIPGKGSRVGEISNFQGLAFHSTPHNSFGWTFEQIPVKSAPGYHAPDTGAWLNPFSVVQIYDTQTVDNADWNLIGLNQWVEESHRTLCCCYSRV